MNSILIVICFISSGLHNWAELNLGFWSPICHQAIIWTNSNPGYGRMSFIAKHMKENLCGYQHVINMPIPKYMA